jgi:hypothetical protein
MLRGPAGTWWLLRRPGQLSPPMMHGWCAGEARRMRLRTWRQTLACGWAPWRSTCRTTSKVGWGGRGK